MAARISAISRLAASRSSPRINSQISSRSRRASGWKSYVIISRRFAAGGGALFAEVSDNLVAGNALNTAAFQVVVAAVEHFARLRKLIKVSLYNILQERLGGSASA